jgi:uncharacterized protein (DUF1015 family)
LDINRNFSPICFGLVDGREGLEGLETRVNSGQAVVAFSIGKISVHKIMQIADADQLLPPKVFHS